MVRKDEDDFGVLHPSANIINSTDRFPPKMEDWNKYQLELIKYKLLKKQYMENKKTKLDIEKIDLGEMGDIRSVERIFKNVLMIHASAIFDNALSVLEKKNHDYSGEVDVLKNFRVSAQVAGVTTEQGILTRLMDKMSRIGNLLQREASVKDESIHDTIMDAINYLAILDYAITENKES